MIIRPVLVAVGLLLLIAAAACSGSARAPSPLGQPPVAATVGTFKDPFAYCASVRNVDKPDARYVGTPVPDSVIQGYLQAAGITSSAEPTDLLRQSTMWRCMDGTVYACNVGANLPCDSKADTNSTPSAGMGDYCKSNPNTEFIPLSVTGHDSVYNWQCVNGSARAGNPVNPVDGRGFLQRIWYPIHPSP